jgi:Na+/H+-dicarboxylate symporter
MEVKKIQVSDTEYWFLKKWLTVKGKYNEQIEKFTESFTNNLPKLLFMYMPVFAFVLWLFTIRKNGITMIESLLHYFHLFFYWC